MSEKTLHTPLRARRVRQITGALAAIPATAPDSPPMLREPGRLTDQSLRQLSDDQKVELLLAFRCQLQQQQRRYSSLLQISSALGATLDRNEFLEITLEQLTELMRAERSTLYLVEQPSGRLHGKIAQGSNTQIVLEPGQGVAGWVAQSGQSINIRDAYNDPRFHADIDSRSGFQTRSMLCQPIRNTDGQIIAVVQVLNSTQGNFSEEDENLLSAIGGQISIALENSALYHSLVDKNQQLLRTKERLEHKFAELDLLYNIQSKLSQHSDLESLIQTITQQTLELVNGKACALTLREEGYHRVHVLIDRSEDYSRAWDFYTRAVTDENTIGQAVIARGQPFVCHSQACQHLPGPTSEADGLHVENIIAVPLFDDETCIGALEVFNLVLPHEPRSLGFTEDDVKIITLIASQIAGTVASRRHREAQEKEHRLASIGQMISGILHDFKTPFSVISGYVQLMADTDDAAEREDFAERVLHQIQQLNQMTRELLKFARGDSKILWRKIFVNTFIQETRELLDTELGDRGVELVIDLKYRGEVRMDVVKMKRAILNLARNAADAMPRGGRFTIAVDRQDDHTLWRFSDTGTGIPPEIRDHLFESFVTQGKADGTGLGLAVVKKIVSDHGGSIDVESAPGQGTTFEIRLPLTPAEEST
ncbi:hypothetical protein DL240_17675 [Lujinxingia litoralis]|uniref:histidine kinase n=1 Tax=Lujinxingia litoralis TaxID=2211119 RepID=A0A328C4I4_9DELT|nr:GAF domain-containing protein [Lujinxingia litoralis]RAL20212.1 hypothetical protein DL240_17675 [Lujinxingia litoralis]